MELRHLRYFVAVAEELHFSRAAERLHVSQPPLSQQIKQLEEEVQVRLFDRSKRWVRLTSAGRLFLEHVRQVLMEVDGAVLAARRTLGGERDRLSVACTPWAGYMAVPHILRRFSERQPDVRIDIQTLNSVQQLRTVKARVIDVAFMWRSPADEDLQIDGLLFHPLVVALPFKHRLASRAYLSHRDLVGESYVTLAADTAPVYSQAVAAYWEKGGIAMKEQHRADRPHAVIELVAAGAGFALVPLPVHEYADQRIVCRRLDPAAPHLELTVARARGVESPAVKALLEVALQIAGQQRSFFTGKGPADAQVGSSDLSAVGRLWAAGEAVQARSNDARPVGARSSLFRATQPIRDSERKLIRTSQTREVGLAHAS
jgi:DNA-binding transcriptional LysR family regulator